MRFFPESLFVRVVVWMAKMIRILWLKFLVLSRNSVGQGLDNPLLACVNCNCRPSVVMTGFVADFPLCRVVL